MENTATKNKIALLRSSTKLRDLVYLFNILDRGKRLFLFILQIKIFVAEPNDVTTYVTSHIHNC